MKRGLLHDVLPLHTQVRLQASRARPIRTLRGFFRRQMPLTFANAMRRDQSRSVFSEVGRTLSKRFVAENRPFFQRYCPPGAAAARTPYYGGREGRRDGETSRNKVELMQECARSPCSLTPIPGKVEKCVAKASVRPFASAKAAQIVRPAYDVDRACPTFISRARISSKVLFACTPRRPLSSVSPPPPMHSPIYSLRRSVRFSTLYLPRSPYVLEL